MSIAKVYSCDICGTPRKQANHWCIGFAQFTGGVLVEAWSDKAAARTNACHFCGVPHATQWVGQRLSTSLEEAKRQGVTNENVDG